MRGVTKDQEGKQLFKTYISIAQYGLYVDRTLCEPYLDSALTVAETLEDSATWTFYYAAKAFLFLNDQMMDSAIVYTKRSMRYHTNDNRVMYSNLNYLSHIYYERDQYDSALHYALESSKYVDKEIDFDQYFNNHVNIARLCYEIKNYNQAKYYCYGLMHETSELYKKSGLALNEILGNVHFAEGLYDSALYYHKKELEVATYIKRPHNQALAYSNLAMVYDKLAEFDLALVNERKSLDISVKRNDLKRVGESRINVARILWKKRDLNTALTEGVKGMNLVRENGLSLVRMEAHEVLSNIYEARGEKGKAFDHLKQFHALSDSINYSQKQAELLALQNQFEYQRQKSEKENLEYQYSMQEISLKNQQLQILGLILFSVLIFVMMVVVFRNNRQVKRLNKTILSQSAELKEAIKMKDRLFSIIGHDLRGPISSFESLSRIVSSYSEKQQHGKVAELMEQVEKSSKNLNRLLDNLLNWSLVQEGSLRLDIKKIHLKEIVDEVLDIYHDLAEAKGVSIDSKVGEEVVWADSDTLSTVVRNLVSNAIKFSGEGNTVQIVPRHEDNYLELMIRDEGVGMSEQVRDNLFEVDKAKVRKGTAKEKGTGLGMILAKELTEMNNGQLQVQSSEGKGTEILIRLKVAS